MNQKLGQLMLLVNAQIIEIHYLILELLKQNQSGIEKRNNMKHNNYPI